MTTTTAATRNVFRDYTFNQAIVLMYGHGHGRSASGYVHDILERHDPTTWASAADLADWRTVILAEPWVPADVRSVIRNSEYQTTVGMRETLRRNIHHANRFDY